MPIVLDKRQYDDRSQLSILGGGARLEDHGVIDATLGESGETVLLTLMDGVRTPDGIGTVTGLGHKLVAARLRVLVELKLARSNNKEYVLTEEGLKVAQIIAEKRRI